MFVHSKKETLHFQQGISFLRGLISACISLSSVKYPVISRNEDLGLGWDQHNIKYDAGKIGECSCIGRAYSSLEKYLACYFPWYEYALPAG